jgi:TorA maturation chaperone TorD
MAAITSELSQFDAATNLARQALYRFAALTLVDPHTGSWSLLRRAAGDGLVSDAAAVLRTSPLVKSVNLGVGERPVKFLDPAAVLDRLPESEDALNSEYESTFGLVVGSACPPYETEYIGSKLTYQRSNSLADISGFYQAFGLTISSGRAERPDHVALELEFMAALLGLERQAASATVRRNERLLTVCCDAQTRFLREHLAWWVPAFAKLLRRENEGGFYAAVGAFLAALIPAERALLNVEPQSRSVAPSLQERPEACEGCQLAT